MITIAGGVSSWADGGTDLNSPPPPLPEDVEFTAEAIVDAADDPASKNLDKNVSENVSKELQEIVRDLPSTKLRENFRHSPYSSSPELIDGSSVAPASKERVGFDGNRMRSMKPFGASPPNPLPMNMIPHHGVAHYRYGYHSAEKGYFVQGWQGNHSDFAHGRPPMFWDPSHGRGAHIPSFYNGRGTPPRPYWDSMHRPDFWGMPFRPLPHHLPPASVPNYVDPMPSRIVKQIDYYFSEPNLVKDLFLRSKMDNQGWVPISLIASFPRVKQLTKSISFILRSLRFSNVVEVQGDQIRKRDNWKKWILALDE